MSISYDISDKGGRRTWSRPLIALAVVNALFAATMLSAWTYISLFVAEPIAWATWMRVYRSNTFMDIFNYPFVILWLLPTYGLAVAWVAGESRRWSMAWASLSLPIIVMGFIFGWFYLAPTDWQ